MKIDIRDGSAWPGKGPRLLSAEAIEAIAVDARTKPPAEVGRHVMPLIGHITATEDRCCETCRHWVRFNTAHGASGECRYHAAEGAAVKVVGFAEELVEGATEAAAVMTPFDWQCKGWAERQPESNEAQKSL